MKSESEIMDRIRELIYDRGEAATKEEQTEMFYTIASNCEIEAEALEEIKTFEEWEKKAGEIYDYPMVHPEPFMCVIPDWKRDREERDREIERLKDMYQVHYKARVAAEAELNAMIELEASVCPEDFGCHEYIPKLEAKIKELEAGLELILPLAKGYVAAHPVGSNARYVENACRLVAEKECICVNEATSRHCPIHGAEKKK